MAIEKISVVYIRNGTKENKDSLQSVRKILSFYKGHIDIVYIERDSMGTDSFSQADLVIVVGGDGTFLRTAQFIEGRQIMLGVNSDPQRKEGFFMCCTKDNFGPVLKGALEGRARVLDLARLETWIGKKRLPLCLNEVYFGDAKPYRMSYYGLRIGRNFEGHRSSGIVVATAAGSHAWIKSAGGKSLALTSREIQVLAREPYIRRLNKQKIMHKVLAPNTTIEIISYMREGMAVVDSVSGEFTVKPRQSLKIKLSAKNLRIVR